MAFFVSPFLFLRRPCQAGLPNVVEVCVTHTSAGLDVGGTQSSQWDATGQRNP